MSRWFRVYDDLVDDPKVQRLPGDTVKALLNLWCLASKNGGNLPSEGDIAFKLRMRPEKVTALLAGLKNAGLIDEVESGFEPHNWSARQFKSDVSNERVKRYRERKCNVTDTVTVTPPDTESEAETETEGMEIVEIPSTKIAVNLAEPVGGRKATRPAISGFFDEFWRVYPKRGDAANPKKPACDKFERAVRGGADPAVIIAAAARYAAIESSAGRSNTEKIAQAVTWLNQQRWQDYPELAGGDGGPPAPPDPSMPSDSELRARYAARIPQDPKPEDEGVFREGLGPDPANEKALRH
jgi:hypothetical protein